jgi:uncharacterized membrane protein (DUF441 family)
LKLAQIGGFAADSFYILAGADVSAFFTSFSSLSGLISGVFVSLAGKAGLHPLGSSALCLVLSHPLKVIFKP